MESGSPEDAQAASEDGYLQGDNGALSSNRLINCYIYSYDYYIKKDLLHKQHLFVLLLYWLSMSIVMEKMRSQLFLLSL